MRKGDKVRDEDGYIGIVKDASDSHNIEVDFLNGGMGLYCIHKECKYHYSPLTLVTNHNKEGNGSGNEYI